MAQIPGGCLATYHFLASRRCWAESRDQPAAEADGSDRATAYDARSSSQVPTFLVTSTAPSHPGRVRKASSASNATITNLDSRPWRLAPSSCSRGFDGLYLRTGTLYRGRMNLFKLQPLCFKNKSGPGLGFLCSKPPTSRLELQWVLSPSEQLPSSSQQARLCE